MPNISKYIEKQINLNNISLTPKKCYKYLINICSHIKDSEKYEFYYELITQSESIQKLIEIMITDKDVLKFCTTEENEKLLNIIDVYSSIKNIEINYDEITNEENYNFVTTVDSLKQYIKEVNRIPLLTKDKEKKYFKRYQEGEKGLKNLLIESNLRLVIKIAFRYIDRNIPILDLISYGNKGLIKAVEQFDVNKEYKFSTYATWWIRQSILRGLDEKRTISIPTYFQQDLKKYYNKMDDLTIELKRIPTPNELSKELNFDLDYILLLSQYSSDVLSLNMKINEDEDEELENLLPDNTTPETIILDKLSNEDLLKEISKLDRLEKIIIYERFGFSNTGIKTIEEICEKYNLDYIMVRRIEARAIRKLRNSLIKRKATFESLDKTYYIDKLDLEFYLNLKDRDIIYSVINELSKEEVDILKSAFGNEFDLPIKLYNLNKKEKIRLFQIIIPKLKNKIIVIYKKNGSIEEIINNEELKLTLKN